VFTTLIALSVKLPTNDSSLSLLLLLSGYFNYAYFLPSWVLSYFPSSRFIGFL